MISYLKYSYYYKRNTTVVPLEVSTKNCVQLKLTSCLLTTGWQQYLLTMFLKLMKQCIHYCYGLYYKQTVCSRLVSIKDGRLHFLEIELKLTLVVCYALYHYERNFDQNRTELFVNVEVQDLFQISLESNTNKYNYSQSECSVEGNRYDSSVDHLSFLADYTLAVLNCIVRF